jgi:hypothetical protein
VSMVPWRALAWWLREKDMRRMAVRLGWRRTKGTGATQHKTSRVRA